MEVVRILGVLRAVRLLEVIEVRLDLHFSYHTVLMFGPFADPVHLEHLGVGQLGEYGLTFFW